MMRLLDNQSGSGESAEVQYNLICNDTFAFIISKFLPDHELKN